MAGIQGQPAPKPTSVPNPVPAKDTEMSFSKWKASQPAVSIETPEAAPETAPAEQGMGSFPGRGAVETVAEYLPAIGGIAGGIGGTPFGGPMLGGVAGATLGASTGTMYRDIINRDILGKQDVPDTIQEQLKSAAWGGIKEGLSQAAGGGLMKGAGAVGKGLMNTELGRMTGELVKHVTNPMGNWVKQEIDEIVEPITKKLGQVLPKRNLEESGVVVKELLNSNINTKYNVFKQAYSALDEVSTATPIGDEARLQFTNKIKEHALNNLSSSNYKKVQIVTDEINRIGNGAQLKDVITVIDDAAGAAYRSNKSSLGKMYSNLANEVEDFYEGEVKKLAVRIQSGKATQTEMGFLTKIMDQRGIVEAHPEKYAKSLANDYMNSLDKISNDYSGFKSFLTDVAEQTKVRMGRKGPGAFVQALDKVPAEKLIERMFDPKNAAALRTMQTETPEIFEEVTGAHLKTIAQRSSPTGELNLKMFQKEINDIPEATRNLFINPKDVTEMNKILANPRIRRLEILQKAGETFIGSWINNLVELTHIGGKKAVQQAGKPLPQTIMRRSVGNALGDVFGGEEK